MTDEKREFEDAWRALRKIADGEVLRTSVPEEERARFEAFAADLSEDPEQLQELERHVRELESASHRLLHEIIEVVDRGGYSKTMFVAAAGAILIRELADLEAAGDTHQIAIGSAIADYLLALHGREDLRMSSPDAVVKTPKPPTAETSR